MSESGNKLRFLNSGTSVSRRSGIQLLNILMLFC